MRVWRWQTLWHFQSYFFVKNIRQKQRSPFVTCYVEKPDILRKSSKSVVVTLQLYRKKYSRQDGRIVHLYNFKRWNKFVYAFMILANGNVIFNMKLGKKKKLMILIMGFFLLSFMLRLVRNNNNPKVQVLVLFPH